MVNSTNQCAEWRDQRRLEMMGGGMMGGGFGSGLGSFGLIGGLIGMVLNIAIIVGVVVLVVWVVQKVSRPGGSSSLVAPTGPAGTGQLLSAREILDIRYARGELTRDEYQTKLSDIS
jgi:putative membrane protein